MSKLPHSTNARIASASLIVALSFTAVAADKSKQDAYTGHLPGGIQVHVVSVGPSESSDLPMWSPDGSAIALSPSGGHETNTSTVPPGKKSIRVRFDITGQTSGQTPPLAFPIVSLHAKLGGIRNSGVSGIGSPVSDQHAGAYFTIPERMTTADLEVAVGIGDFVTVASNTDGSGDLPVTLMPTHDKQISKTVYSSGQIKEDYRLRDMVELNFEVPPSILKKQWCLSIATKSGKPVRPMMNPAKFDFGSDFENARYWKALLMVDSHDIQRIELKARDYKWVKIRNVHLVPNTSVYR